MITDVNKEPIKAIIEIPPFYMAQIVRESAPVYAREKAYQECISKTYTVEQAAIRLNVCEATIRNLIDKNKIRYTLVGKKGYRISELACREFMGDINNETASFAEGEGLKYLKAS